MRVGNVDVNSYTDGSVRIRVLTGTGWELEFVRNERDRYYADLIRDDIFQGLRNGRKGMQREVLDSLERRGLPGSRHGKLRQAIDAVRSIYGL